MLLCGATKADINPDFPIHLMGYRADLISNAVHDDIIGARMGCPGVAVEQRLIFCPLCSERVVHGEKTVVVVAPFEEWEFGHP